MARALLQEMRELGHEPNKFCWNAVINVHARTGDTEGAFTLRALCVPGRRRQRIRLGSTRTDALKRDVFC